MTLRRGRRAILETSIGAVGGVIGYVSDRNSDRAEDDENGSAEALPVRTLEPEPVDDSDGETVRLRGRIDDLGGYAEVGYGFEYGPVDEGEWDEFSSITVQTRPGEFTHQISIEHELAYEYAAFVEVDDTRYRGDVVTFHWEDLEDEYIERDDHDVEFVSCTRVEISGTFRDEGVVAVSTGFYQDGYYGNTRVENSIRFGEDVEAPFSGTVVVEIGEESRITERTDEIVYELPEFGNDGTVLTGVTTDPSSYEAGGIDHFNPDGEACLDAIEPVDETDSGTTISIAETNTPVYAGDTLDIIAEVENLSDTEATHEVRLLVGEDQVQVDSRTVTVDGNETRRIRFEYETPTVETTRTFPARVEMADVSAEETVEVLGEDTDGPSTLSVAITDTNAPVAAGEHLEVTAELENTGSESVMDDLSLFVGRNPEFASGYITEVDPDSTQRHLLWYETAPPDRDDSFPIRVEFGNVGDERTVRID